jgi:hypothetical protein
MHGPCIPVLQKKGCTWLIVVAAQVAELHDARAGAPRQHLSQLPPRRLEFVRAPALQVQVPYNRKREVLCAAVAEGWVQAF